MRETAQSSVKQSTCWVTRDRDHSRLHTSCPYNMRKMLPHIAEEYDYQTTNRLLMEKISHPRRNKLILDSLRTCDGQHRVTHYSGDSDSRKRRRIGAKVVRMLKSRE